MLFVLGIGSNVAMASCIMTVIRDRFPQIKHVWASCIVALFGLSFGLVYVTPVSLNLFITYICYRIS